MVKNDPKLKIEKSFRHPTWNNQFHVPKLRWELDSAVAEPPNRTEIRRTWHFRTEPRPNRTEPNEHKGLVRMFGRKI